MAQVRSSFAENYTSIAANIRKTSHDAYEIEKSVHSQIFNINMTDKPIVRDESFSGVGKFSEKPEGDYGAVGNIYHLYPQSYTPVTYSLYVAFSSEAVDDDQLNVIKNASSSMGVQARATEDILAASILNLGWTTAGPDGKTLFAADHPLLLGGTTQNEPSAGMALSFTNLQIALKQWARYQKNQQGDPIESDPAYLVVPPELQPTAGEILKSMGNPENANNVINIIKDDYSLQRVVWKKITDTASWFLLAKPSQHQINVFVRKAYKLYTGADDERGRVWMRGEFRRDQGFSGWEGTYGTSPSQ